MKPLGLVRARKQRYLTYKAKLFSLFKAQHKVMRVIFGGKAKYLDKFKTCARVRPFNDQRLTTVFFLLKNIANHSPTLMAFLGGTFFFYIYFLINLKIFTLTTVAVKFSSRKVLLGIF